MCKPKVGRKEGRKEGFSDIEKKQREDAGFAIEGAYKTALSRRRRRILLGRASRETGKSASSLRECVVVDFENDELVLSSFSLQTLLLLPTLPKFSDGWWKAQLLAMEIITYYSVCKGRRTPRHRLVLAQTFAAQTVGVASSQSIIAACASTLFKQEERPGYYGRPLLPQSRFYEAVQSFLPRQRRDSAKSKCVSTEQRRRL